MANRKETRGERVIRFIETHCRVPEGALVGQPVKLADFQIKFILAVYDNEEVTTRAYLSMARKNAKTATIAFLLLAHICGPEAQLNSQIISGAASRDQAALVHGLACKTIMLNPKLEKATHIVPSKKQIFGLALNVEYKAVSADASTAHGMSPILAILDEVGQVVGPASSPFIEAIETSQGAHSNPLLIAISTQAASDGDMFSLWIDDAERSGDPHIVSHVYAADEGCDLMDESQWKKANPALGLFRSEKDLRTQLEQAERMPSKEASARNLLLNQRIALEQLAIPPAVWKSCAGDIDMEIFKTGPVHLGLDLSARNDLTAAVACAEDEDGVMHVWPLVFCPSHGIEARSQRDRAPYAQWVKDGWMIPVGANSMDYDQIAEAIKNELELHGVQISSVLFDKAMAVHFRAACERQGALLEADWEEVPQHFKTMGLRLASLQGMMVEKRVLHGGHPVMAMAATNAVAAVGREGITALAKNKSTQRIDPLVALVMGAWPFGDGRPNDGFDVAAMIG